MSMYKCPVCGELFSTSYKKCPFCEEDDLLMDRHKTTAKHRRRNEPRAVGPLLIVIFLLLVALVIFLVAGDRLFGGGSDADADVDVPPVEDSVDGEDGDASDADEPVLPETTPMTLDQTAAELTVGETLTLTAAEGSGTYTWSSADESVATVADGVVTAIAEGSAAITVSDGETELSCTVTVKSLPLSINKTDVSIAVGESFTIGTEGSGTITFHSDNESVAVVGSDGVVTGKAKGKANITVSNGSTSLSCIVRVVR